MKNLFKGLAVFAALVAFVSPVLAQDVPGFIWKNYDGEYAFQIKYSGTGSATVTVTSTTIVLSDSGQDTTTYITNATGAEVVAAIAAVTNASGVKNFQAKLWASLAADTYSNKLVAASATALTKDVWTPLGAWDADVALHSDVVVSAMIGDSVYNPAAITDIVADPIGTGAVTVNVYSDGTKMFQKTYPSTYYTSDGTNYTVEAVVPVAISTPIKCAADKVTFVRVARATSMTTTSGGVGVSTKN